MKYERGSLGEPTSDDSQWYFRDDLRAYFGFSSNVAIAELLVERGVMTAGVADPESACLWVYFDTEAEGLAFLDRLNAQVEISEYISEFALNARVRDLQVTISMKTNINVTSPMVQEALMEYFATHLQFDDEAELQMPTIEVKEV